MIPFKTEQIKRFLSTFFIAALTLLWSVPVLAQQTTITPPQQNTATVDCTTHPNDILCSSTNLLISPTNTNRQEYVNRIRSGGIGEIFNHITSLFASGAAVFAVTALIYGCFLLVTSHGNEEQVTKAKQFITLTIMGLVILILTYVIVISLRDLLYAPPQF